MRLETLKDKSLVTVRTCNKIAKRYAEAFTAPSSFIDTFVSLLPPRGKVLDAGCGPGQDSSYLFRYGLEVEGIDLSKEMVGLARKLVPQAAFAVMDMRRLRYPDCCFDGLLVSLSQIHVPKKDADRTVSEFRRVLKEGGIRYLHVFEGAGELILPEPLDQKAHTFLSRFQLEEVEGLLAKFGFKPLVVNRTVIRGDGEFSCNKILVVAKKVGR